MIVADQVIEATEQHRLTTATSMRNAIGTSDLNLGTKLAHENLHNQPSLSWVVSALH